MASVEFAIVALPTLVILFSILEIGLLHIGNAMLQKAVADAGRSIMTGEIRGQDRAGFTSSVCRRLPALFDCANNLDIDVRTLKSFEGAAAANPFVDGAYDTRGWGYAPGGRGSIVVVTAAYPWPIRTDLVSLAKTGAAGAPVLLAVSAFKNEDF